jgi:hypothetical protein
MSIPAPRCRSGGCALVVLLATTGVASAQTIPNIPKVEKREWAVAVRITQDSSWSGGGQQGTPDCLEDVTLSGNEQIFSDTPTAGRLMATKVGGLIFAGGNVTITGEVTRHSRIRDAWSCPDFSASFEGLSDGCGTHPFSGTAAAGYDAKKQRLTFVPQSPGPAALALARCAPSYGVFPGTPVEIPLLRRELFSNADHISRSASQTASETQRQLFLTTSTSTRVTVSVELFPVGGDPVAVPGKYRSVLRGAAVALNGSRSRAKRGRIVSYRWTFDPGPGCPQGTTVRATPKIGARVSVKLLCPVVATLKVTDNRGQTDTKSTVVGVKARSGTPWTTPFTRREELASPGRGFTSAPEVLRLPSGDVAITIEGGLNTTDCGAEAPGSVILCPFAGGSSRRGKGYELTRLKDPGGPFNDYWWVASSAIDVKRVELINPKLTPGVLVFPNRGSLYDENAARGNPVAAFLEAIKQHEGLGKASVKDSGHSEIIKRLTNEQNPRAAVEKLFGPTEQQAQTRADDTLAKIDDEIDKASNDPLPGIFNSGPLAFWDESRAVWESAPKIHVP